VSDIAITTHDQLPPDDASVVDAGLGAFNDAAAPLHEVHPLSCFARDARGGVIGGVVGRTWGPAAEILQLWVAEPHRHRGIGNQLVRTFESRAAGRGCRTCYLETLSFQAPRFYASLGYRVVFELRELPYGIIKYTMLRDITPEVRDS
jgi:ribosomal protein S18 acetylase RimI-like enzyme